MMKNICTARTNISKQKNVFLLTFHRHRRFTFKVQRREKVLLILLFFNLDNEGRRQYFLPLGGRCAMDGVHVCCKNGIETKQIKINERTPPFLFQNKTPEIVLTKLFDLLQNRGAQLFSSADLLCLYCVLQSHILVKKNKSNLRKLDFAGRMWPTGRMLPPPALNSAAMKTYVSPNILF